MKKISVFALAAFLGISFAFGANLDKLASDTSTKVFELKKEASKLDYDKRADICKQIYELKFNARKNLNSKDLFEFNRSYRYEMAKKMSSLNKDEFFDLKRVCRGLNQKNQKNYAKKNSNNNSYRNNNCDYGNCQNYHHNGKHHGNCNYENCMNF